VIYEHVPQESVKSPDIQSREALSRDIRDIKNVLTRATWRFDKSCLGRMLG
jgi:hypothetical protein